MHISADECPGSGELAEGVPRLLNAERVGECPTCRRRFVLGYGLLPTHDKAGRIGTTVGGRIRQRRLELGLTYARVAVPGISTTHIGRIERGERNPSSKVLRLLAPRLAVSVHWLEFGVENPAEQLAQLVLDGQGGSRAARALARRVLPAQSKRDSEENGNRSADASPGDRRSLRWADGAGIVAVGVELATHPRESVLPNAIRSSARYIGRDPSQPFGSRRRSPRSREFLLFVGASRSP